MWFKKNIPLWHTIENPPKTSLTITKECDICSCTNRGDYKAPKSRDTLNEYYWFCLEHVQEYNKNWDFFKGMSATEVEEQMLKNFVGDRPTWKAENAGQSQDRLKRKIYKSFTQGEDFFDDFYFGKEEAKAETKFKMQSIPHPAIDALETMGLEPPIVWDKVKTHYKMLVKKYHPDTNKDNPKAEEKMKKINLAYSILKISYKDYTELEER